MRRRIPIAPAVAAAAGGVFLAVLPFTTITSLDLAGVPGGEGVSAVTSIEARCRPPIVNAWQSHGNSQGTWAVTVGTNMQGYASPGPGCVDSSRRRLAGSLGLGLVALGAGVMARRTRPGTTEDRLGDVDGAGGETGQ
jgi:hypothetical protein